MKAEPNLIWNWRRCEALAKELKIELATNGGDIISIIKDGNFIYNAQSVEAVHAFLTALQTKTP